MIFEDNEKNKIVPGTLYLVATPIGNLEDISYRAVKVLKNVDLIAAEDTRNSAKLLSCLEIKNNLISYHEHNTATRGPELIEKLKSGTSIALITDAGTPGVSDPGADLVRLCAENGVAVTAVPGCVASITALTISGIDTRYFAFEGFLPVKKSERNARLALLKNDTRTLLFHEAPHKLKETLNDLKEAFGNGRRIALCRELTKLNEEVQRLTLGEAVALYQDKEPRGEYVLVLEGAKEGAPQTEGTRFDSVIDHYAYYLSQGMDKKDAIKAVAKDRGLNKNDVYMAVVQHEKEAD